eukprot:7693368-Pyramimonas_sp.AAC.1
MPCRRDRCGALRGLAADGGSATARLTVWYLASVLSLEIGCWRRGAGRAPAPPPTPWGAPLPSSLL